MLCALEGSQICREEVFEGSDSQLSFILFTLDTRRQSTLHSMFVHEMGPRPFLKGSRDAGSNFSLTPCPLNSSVWYSFPLRIPPIFHAARRARGLSFRSDSATIEDVNLTTLEGSNTNVSLVGLLGLHGGGDAE